MTWAALLVLLVASTLFFVASLVHPHRGSVFDARAGNARDTDTGPRSGTVAAPEGAGRSAGLSPPPTSEE